MIKDFKNFEDYILKITQRIWEGRDIASLHRYYAQDVIVRTPGGIETNNQQVIASTMAVLNEFPDRQLLGEDVIWCGNLQDGMLSSHRIYNTATHCGEGVFGPPTFKKVYFRGLADCYAKNNQISDEWLVRDQAAIVKQLGMNPKEYALKTIKREGGFEKASKPFNLQMDIVGPYQGSGNHNQWGEKLQDILQKIMCADFSTIAKNYDRACHLSYSGGIDTVGVENAEKYWIGLRSSFPNAKFQICHKMGMENSPMPARGAVRWSLEGVHDGWGMFGKPTGAKVYIMGITHGEFGNWGLRKEYSLIDETAIWKQILLHQGEY